MECAIESKVMLIRAALERYGEYTPTAQRAIGEGIFWLCDQMLEAIRDSPKSDYYRSNLNCLKDMANEMVKRTFSADEIFEASTYCAKLLHYPQEGHGGSP